MLLTWHQAVSYPEHPEVSGGPGRLAVSSSSPSPCPGPDFHPSPLLAFLVRMV